MKTILFFHHSSDLYGSDKSLLTLLKKLDKTKYRGIVLLPQEGPLFDELKKYNILCFIVPLVITSRSSTSFKFVLTFPFKLIKSLFYLNNICRMYKIHIIHSNTLAVLSGAILSKIKRINHIWCVREIIIEPQLALKIYKFLLTYFSNTIVFNSRATRDHFIKSAPFLQNKSKVIVNSVDLDEFKSQNKRNNFRKYLGINDNISLITLIGRINRWKGHVLLVKAAEILFQRNIRNLRYLIVGSTPPNQEHYKNKLIKILNDSSVQSLFTILNFQKNIPLILEASDIAVVPSTEPEPFGIVAIEAMAAKKPVIAANHGGLREIIKNGITGIFFKPNDPIDLANSIEHLVINRKLQVEMGQAGLIRAESLYSNKLYVSLFERAYSQIE